MEKRQKRITNEKNWWINSLIGGGIGLAISMLAALLMPILLLKLDDTYAFILPAAGLCLFAGGIAGGIIGALNTKGREIISGLINSGVMLSAMLLVSFMFKKGFDLIGFLILTAVIILSSLLGAFAVMKTNNSQKRNMNRMMKRR